jgi:arabinofuranosyltransferase
VRSHSTARLRSGIASLVTIGLGPLVRPELSLVSLVFVVAILVNLRASVRMGIFGILLASLPPIGYEIFRAGYYGLLVPLPALAKEAAVADLSRGSAYLWDFVEPYWLAVPLPAVGVLLVLGTLPRSRAGDRRSSRSDILKLRGTHCLRYVNRW